METHTTTNTAISREGSPAASLPCQTSAAARPRLPGAGGGLRPLDPPTPNAGNPPSADRPQHPPPLTERVTLRLPADAANQWRQQAKTADLTLSDWVRRRVDGGHAVPAAKPKRQRRLRTLTADPSLLRQLASLGSNMNQIARVLNSAGLTPSDHLQWLAELAAIQRELYRLAELPRYEPDDQGEEV